MKKWVIGLLLVSTVLIFTRLELLALIGFLLAIAILPRRRDWPRRLVWAYLIFFALVCALYELAWLAKIAVPATAVVIGLGLVSWIYVICYKTGSSVAKTPINPWWGIAVGLLVCLYVFVPILKNPSYATAVRYAAKTGDDINHISFIEADRQVKGYVYDNTARNRQLLIPSSIGYPQGWHINGALLESLFLKLIGKDDLGNRALSYLLYKTFWVFLATFLGYELMGEVAAAFFPKQGKLPAWAAAASTLVISVGLVVAADGYGFADFIGAIALVTASLTLACQLIRYGETRRSSRYILALAALTFAATSVWVLPGATLGLFTLIMLAYLYRHGLTRLKPWEWALFLGAMVLCIIQILLTRQFSQTKDGSIMATFNLAGAVPTISTISVAILVIVCVALAAWLKPKLWKWLVAIIVASALEFFALAIYQRLAVGDPLYYAIKLAILSAFVLGLILLATVAAGFKLGGVRRAYYYRAALFIIIIVAIPLALRLNTQEIAYPLGNSAPIGPTTASRLLATNPSVSPNKIFTGANSNETYLATKFWSEVRPYNSPATEKLLNSL